MGLGQMNGFADIVKTKQVKDSEGFTRSEDEVLASIRVYREGRHGSERLANLAAFSEATDLFRFRCIPGLTITTEHFLICDGERFNITSVETVVLLSKGEIDSKKVRVEFSLEDMDMSGFQKGATYEQIKAYVLEHTGLKVSSLYISQIKRKCGLDVGQNYNLSKKEDAKVPKCPPEKEAAIRDALKYFQMI